MFSTIFEVLIYSITSTFNEATLNLNMTNFVSIQSLLGPLLQIKPKQLKSGVVMNQPLRTNHQICV